MTSNYQFFVYIMGSISGVLYVGISRSADGRVWQHKSSDGSSFTSKYKCGKLLYYEEHRYINNAIAREKQIKNWRREKKIALITSLNPKMTDLAFDWEYCKPDSSLFTDPSASVGMTKGKPILTL